MTTTHSFNDDEDYSKGGQWFDDYGGRICEWSWDAPSKVLTVECGIKGSRRDLSQFDEQSYTEETLEQRLPVFALNTAETLNSTKYDL